MDKKTEVRQGHGSGGKGKLTVVGIGPGGLEHLTPRAKEAIEEADVIVGYTRYVNLIAALIKDKDTRTSGMTEEAARCSLAIDLAGAGKTVAVVSSGDSGIYGMAGLVLQLAGRIEGAANAFSIEIVPGIPAFVSAAAILGAPIMHDFASISLSDLLTPWETIEERINAAAKAGFVMIFYNPKSSKRTEGLKKAIAVVRAYRGPDTPIGIVRNAERPGQWAVAVPLKAFDAHYDDIDMLTIIIIGSPATSLTELGMITPRGYKDV